MIVNRLCIIIALALGACVPSKIDVRYAAGDGAASAKRAALGGVPGGGFVPPTKIGTGGGGGADTLGPDGDKGDATIGGAGTTITIDPNAIDLTKQADIATGRIIGRVSAGTGDPEVLNGTQATTLLDTFTSTLKGLVPPSSGGTSNFLRADGGWAQPPGLGDITAVNTTSPLAGGVTSGAATLSLTLCAANQIYKVSGGVWSCSADVDTLGPDGDKGDGTISGTGTTLTIDPNAITYAKMQDVTATSRLLGRFSAGAGDPEELTGTQATSLLDLFATGATTKGLVPGSNGATTSCLKGDGTWSGCDVIGVQTDSSTGTLNDFPLGASTTMLVFTSLSSASINGMTGGTDGRCVDIVYLGVGTLSFNNEQPGSTAANRFVTANTASWPTSPNSQTRACYVGGTTNRWTINRDHRMSSLTTAGSINAGTTINASTNLTVAGGATLGDATSDNHAINGTVSQFAGAGYYLARSAAVAQSQIQVDSNGSGMIALRGGGADDNAITFDLERFNSIWTAHDTSIAGITKRGDRLNFGCLNGTSNGTNVTTSWETSTAYDDCGYVDLATLGWSLPATLAVGTHLTVTGNATISGTGNVLGPTNLGDGQNSDAVTINGGYVRDTGTPPSTAGWTCGTSPSVTGGRFAFNATVGTGTITTCVITGLTFNSSNPTCQVTGDKRSQYYISASSATSLSITTQTASNLASDKLFITCIDH